MELDPDSVLLLIQEFEKHRLLWDATNKYHFNKRMKIDAWTQIAESLDIDIEDATKKIKSLLGSFRREKAKQLKMAACGKGEYKSDWFAFKSFAFLFDKYKPKKAFNPKREREPDMKGQIGDLEINPCSSSLADYKFEIPTMQSPDSDSNQQQDTKRHLKSLSLKRKRVRIEENDNDDSRIENLYRYLEESREPEDSTTKFASYLVEKLNQFDLRTKATLIHKINTLMFETEMCAYADTTNDLITQSSAFEDPTAST